MRYILAVDPGRSKTGYAVVCADGTCTQRHIVPTNTLVAHIPETVWDSVEGIVCGDGTFHQEVYERLCAKAMLHNRTVSLIDERFSTVEARQLYWTLHPPTGWWRLIPTSWRTPPVPLDDITAWILGRRYWHQ